MPETNPRGFRCDLLVFDLDGTLIDSRQDLANSVNAALQHVGRPKLDQHRIAGFIGDGAAVLLERALQATGGVNDTLLQLALTAFLSHYHEHKLDTTYVYPGALGAMQAIRDVDPLLPMAVLTNKPVNPSVAICDALALAPFFFAVRGGNSFETKKPDPLGLFSLMQEAAGLRGSGVDPRRTVLIGDSDVDVQTARAAGVLCLGCAYGLAPERLQAARPDVTVNSPSEWPEALRMLLPLSSETIRPL